MLACMIVYNSGGCVPGWIEFVRKPWIRASQRKKQLRKLHLVSASIEQISPLVLNENMNVWELIIASHSFNLCNCDDGGYPFRRNLGTSTVAHHCAPRHWPHARLIRALRPSDRPAAWRRPLRPARRAARPQSWNSSVCQSNRLRF